MHGPKACPERSRRVPVNGRLRKGVKELWEHPDSRLLGERFQWLLDSPGIGVLTGEAGVGKTAALRKLTQALNPHRYQVVYSPETDPSTRSGQASDASTCTATWPWNSASNPLTGAPNCGATLRQAQGTASPSTRVT